MSFLRDLRIAYHSLMRTPGLALTVVLTLALGIGANAAIFTLVRGILLKPLVNRDENRLIYIRQSAPGLRDENSTFSVPEIQDITASAKTLSAFGDFSVIGFAMTGLGEPREVQAGVVSGSYFDVMGLHPVLGRLIGPSDDGPKADGVAVLTYRFWSTSLGKDPSLIGRTIRLDSGFGGRSAKIIGVLEPSVPYPQDTEIIANIVTSPHHLSATMATGRVHRMTELFGRLAPGVTLDQARAELRSVYGAMTKAHPEAYPPNAHFQITAKLLRDELTSDARSVLLVLLAASGLVFVIACSNVANLVLTRTIRREGELAIRAALGATKGALRRMLLAESLLLCSAGALFGVMSAQPLVAILARYAARFSVRAIDLTVDSSLLWVGGGLAVVAAVILAFVPRLPKADTSNLMLSSGSVRTTGNATRRQRIFAVTQVAASFVLLAGACMLVNTLIALQTARTGFDTRHVLAVNVPPMTDGRTPQQVLDFYKEAIRRVDALPGVSGTAFGILTPWRDGGFGVGLQFSGDGLVHTPGQEDPRAQMRIISPGFFAALGVPILEGRDFDEADNSTNEPVAIISESLAQRLYPGKNAVGRHLYWTDPVLQFAPGITGKPQRIIGVAAEIDDTHIVPEPMPMIYGTFQQGPVFGGRLFIHASVNPYSLVLPVTRTIRGISADQPVERAATLEDVRAEVLTPERLNSVVFGVFAAVALAISLVGVAGVLAFSVTSRTREFGIRLALGSPPQRLLKEVIAEGAVMASVGVVAGAVFGYIAMRLANSYWLEMKTPGALPIIISIGVLMAAAIIASSWPAARAARVDVIQALRTE